MKGMKGFLVTAAVVVAVIAVVNNVQFLRDLTKQRTTPAA